MEFTLVQMRIKHLLDRFVAGVALMLISPVLMAIALAIKLDDHGPVFFRQDRIGRGRRKFRVFKFRSMIVNADRLLDALGGVGNQNRITRIGGFLRRWSLDELPQLINVVRGEMSLVGPRPVLPAHVCAVQP